jgi:hypothetical protein
VGPTDGDSAERWTKVIAALPTETRRGTVVIIVAYLRFQYRNIINLGGEMSTDNTRLHAAPEGPFLEYWTFQISFEAPNAPDPVNPLQVRNSVIYQMQHGHPPTSPQPPPTPETLDALHLINETIEELAANRLSDPSFDFHIVDYKERGGSLEIAFTLLAVVYAGVVGYGGFRQGLDYLQEDLRKAFESARSYPVKIRRRFSRRREM